MENVILLASVVVTGLLIWRFRAVGVLVSIPLAWGLLALNLLLPRPETWQEREFREDWPGVSAVLGMCWCLRTQLNSVAQ